MNITKSIPYLLSVSLLGCGAAAQPKRFIQLTTPKELCSNQTLPDNGFCLPADRIEKLLKAGDMTVLQARATASGTAGAQTFWLDFPKEHVVLKAKWKEAARGGSALNNEPRKELAAYQLQKLFLDQDEYVVPPTVGRCIPLELYKAEVRPTKPTFPGTDCAFGALSYWLEGISEMGPFDKGRFETDLKYRAAIANLNLFTYIFDHRDTRASNFAITKNKDEPRAFAIDNGLALSGLKNPRTAFLHEWERIVVNKVPHEKIDRLRKITRADLDKLATVAEFSINGKQLDEIPTTAAFEDDEGVRLKENIVQLGLKTSEIDGIEARIKDLLQRVDTGKLTQY